MAYRWHPKNAEVDPDNPRAWAQCDRCGMLWNLDKLQWQYQYMGSVQPQNTRFLVCPKHLDPLNAQDTPNILPPDPVPVFNARPGATDIYGETSYLSTEDGDIIDTQDGDSLITAIPNPGDAANTTYLLSSISAPGGSVATAYLDLFDGDPSAGGRSVLSLITGSNTRTDISADLSTVSGYAKNYETLSVVAASENQTNVSWVAIYSASISGALLMSGPCSASPTIALGNPVVFPALGLSINLNV